jgi:NADH-quinone oxidoreductase subunit N
MGLPILLGFFGKLFLFTAGVFSGEYVLVVVLALNSAIAAFYYLRLMFYPLTESRDDEVMQGVRRSPFAGRPVAGALSAGSVLALVPFVPALTSAADHATRYETSVEIAAGYERAESIAIARDMLDAADADDDADDQPANAEPAAAD